MSWAYNDIDVYVTDTDNVLGETSVDTSNWTPLSALGTLRGRPALTPSTVSADALEIPGRDGTTYNVDARRGNAKVEFEILIADSWTHAALDMTVRERADCIFSLLNSMKRVAWKCPGRDADSYFLVYKTTLTVTDGDEKAYTIKASLEVHPFEWLFEGNKPELTENHVLVVRNPLPLSRCMPVVVVNGAGAITYTPAQGTQFTCITATASSYGDIVIDSWKEMVYTKTGTRNANRNVTGDLTNLWIYTGETITITSSFNSEITVYTRKGIIR